MISLTVLSAITSRTSVKCCPNLASGNGVIRWYAKGKPPCDPLQPNPPCRRAYADIEPVVDPNCPRPCDRYKEKKGIMHRIKLKVTEGGTNFGTPFRWLECMKLKKRDKTEKFEEDEEKKPKAIAAPLVPVPEERRGVQVSVLGADTNIGQYVALLLKQCPCIKKLRLYEARDSKGCSRSLAQVVEDLQHINTNCRVQAFSCACFELERCLQNSDIVLMLDSGHVSADMSLADRFAFQAPIVKCYSEAIATECPKAFIIVCATPIDCMVPVVAQSLRSFGVYDPAKLLGSLAVPEMRASTLAARYLCLEPRYTRVPCVGGTEGIALVPLFSRAVDFFDFCEKTAGCMTNALRTLNEDVLRCEGHCVRASDLSEAHALAGLVTKVASALLCIDIPRVTGFVETDKCHIISPAKFMANPVEIGGSGIRSSLGLPRLTPRETTYLGIEVLLSSSGIVNRFDFPKHMSHLELNLLEHALDNITRNVRAANKWFKKEQNEELRTDKVGMKTQFYFQRKYDRLKDCVDTLA